MTPTVLHGDVLDVLPTLADASVDAVVCDPPYALGFMGHAWDTHTPAGFQRWCEAWAAECLRVLTPGGHLLAFGGTRTVHRLTSGIEDAGFEIRDGIDWLYGSGFPKSLNVSEAVDKHRAARGSEPVDVIRAWLNCRRLDAGLNLKQVNDALGAASNGGGLASAWMTNPTSKGMPDWQQWCALKALLGFGDEMDAEVRRLHEVASGEDRPVTGERQTGIGTGRGSTAFIGDGDRRVTGAATVDAARWSGWGTALKPAREPIVMARKPLAGTVAANVQQHGTGALNIAACRVGNGSDRTSGGRQGSMPQPMSWGEPTGRARPEGGRWPTNVIMSHAGDDDTGDLCADGCAPGCPVAELDGQSGVTTSGSRKAGTYGLMGYMGADAAPMPAVVGDTGGASRFYPVFRYQAKAPARERPKVDGVSHPTVKPLDLMRWLVRLITPAGGHVLDPFAGSGTTVEACLLEGFDVTAVESEAAYLPLIAARVARITQ